MCTNNNRSTRQTFSKKIEKFLINLDDGMKNKKKEKEAYEQLRLHAHAQSIYQCISYLTAISTIMIMVGSNSASTMLYIKMLKHVRRVIILYSVTVVG